jgi:hypothetical protein
VSTWIDSFLLQHRELETPLSFWYWSALSAVSAVVKDNVWIDRQIYNLYPNIYVMLHAESGLKKGPAISAAKQLVREVGGTRVISGRSSIQGILKELGTAQTQPGGKVINKSVAFICSSELTSSIVEDKVATDILTDLYDRQYNIGEWRSLLKMEQFNLKDPTITMLTATNDAHSTDFFGKKDIHGGYFARTFIVTATKRNRVNSLLSPLTNPPNYIQSASYLKDIAKLSGPFKPLAQREKTEECYIPHFSTISNETSYYSEAGMIYEEWYKDITQTISDQEIKDDTGTLNRFGDSVLKVAMLVALSRNPELRIDPDSMNEAITNCEKLIGNVREMTHGQKGFSNSNQFKELIIKTFVYRESHHIGRTELMRMFTFHYKDSNEFDDIMQAFDQSGVIMTEVVGNQIIYRMPELVVKDFVNLFNGKMR